MWYCSTIIVQAVGDPMQETRTSTPVESAKRIAVRRRAKRGLVAGYIHEISQRHTPVPQKQPKTETARAA
jgi:hypothetical protein